MSAQKIPVIEIPTGELKKFDPEHFSFGKSFTNYMLEADYIDGEWKNAVIKKFAPLSLDPSSAVLHYGQTIFEGIKAFKNEKGEVAIFRPDQNFIRFNLSAERMQMPAVPSWLFMDGMKQLVALEKEWIPSAADSSL